MPREVYPRPPLRLVVAELRYPFAPKLAAPEVLQDLTARFRSTFPIPEAANVQIMMAVGRSAAQPSPPVANRFLSKDRTASVTVTPTNMVIETSDYGEYGRFRPMLQTCLEALGSVRDGIVGVERAGLRYLNEVRVPGLADTSEWTQYLAPDLVAPLRAVPNRRVTVMQSVVQTEPLNDITTLVRFGALRGQAVSSAGPLRVPEVHENDPFFLLDFDNSWTSAEAFDEYTFEATLDLYDRLHGPIDELFEWGITDRLREVFRRAE